MRFNQFQLSSAPDYFQNGCCNLACKYSFLSFSSFDLKYYLILVVSSNRNVYGSAFFAIISRQKHDCKYDKSKYLKLRRPSKYELFQNVAYLLLVLINPLFSLPKKEDNY